MQSTSDCIDEKHVAQLKEKLCILSEIYSLQNNVSKDFQFKRKISQYKIETAHDLSILELMIALLSAYIDLISKLKGYTHEQNDAALLKINSAQETFTKLITDNKSKYQNDIKFSERLIIIRKAGIIVCGVASLAIAFSFIALAPNLVLIGFFCGSIPSMLIPIMAFGYIEGKYKKELNIFSIISSAENLSNKESKAYSSIFKAAKEVSLKSATTDCDIYSIGSTNNN